MKKNESVHVQVDLSDNHKQEIQVTIKWFAYNKRQVLSLPNWTPGSYTIRDHAQYLYELKIFNEDKQLLVDRIATNTWEVSNNDYGFLKLQYRVIAKEFTVRTSYIDNEFGLFTLPSVIMKIEERKNNIHLLEIIKPNEWQTYIPLDGFDTKTAENYDSLVDAPLNVGKFYTENINVGQRTHQIILNGKTFDMWDKKNSLDVEKICTSVCKLMNTEPPSGNKYQFIIYFIRGGYGGLEHDNSSVIQYDPYSLLNDSGYRKFLQLIGHEYLHQWNIRRLRPKEYVKYNYNIPVICESLWFAEGVTSYFDIFLPYLSGITTQTDIYSDISKLITRYLNSPGRFHQSLSDSSKESWIKLYKSDLSSIDTQISYYNLGSLVSFCLDILLREKNYSLASLLRSLWNNKNVRRNGYTRDDITEYLDKIDKSLSLKLNQFLDSSGTLDIEYYLAKIGLELRSEKIENEHGLSFCLVDNRIKVTRINSNASKSSLVIGDEIIAINKFAVKEPTEINTMISRSKDVYISFIRNGILHETKFIVLNSNKMKYEVTKSKNIKSKNDKLREDWLKII